MPRIESSEYLSDDIVRPRGLRNIQSLFSPPKKEPWFHWLLHLEVGKNTPQPLSGGGFSEIFDWTPDILEMTVGSEHHPLTDWVYPHRLARPGFTRVCSEDRDLQKAWANMVRSCEG